MPEPVLGPVADWSQQMRQRQQASVQSISETVHTILEELRQKGELPTST